MHYYEIAPTRIIRKGSDWFTYHSDKSIEIGSFLTIPIGSSTSLGIVLKSVSRPGFATKPITNVLDIPPLPSPLLLTAIWIAEYYVSPLATVLQTILPRGIQKTRREISHETYRLVRKRTHFLLNESQRKAVDHILVSTPTTFLLHGITGSGKTAVYIELIRSMIDEKKSAILLVPEIALTSQLVDECRHHFTNVIVTHSRQTESERHQLWLRVARETQPIIVIGPRSALFFPIRDLGLIIIDEAHEPSYKQEQSPRYSALRVASVLAKNTHGRCVMGTATPSVTDYYLAARDPHSLVTIPHKVHTGSPASVHLVDMTDSSQFSRHSLFSNKLLSAIDTALEKKTQVLIFHNRRGSASLILCEKCGWSALCEHCLVPYTLHGDRHILGCHICSGERSVPTSCPECASTSIIFRGIGTKRIEQEVRRLYPQARIARFDGDASKHNTLDLRYGELYDGSIDIIIGTQVVAKGLDLPHLSTVAIVQADAGLMLPDYAASERSFQLITQVIGRAGRTERESCVIVQSYQPTHPAIQFGITADYAGFYSVILQQRKRAVFPPFTYLLKLTCAYKSETIAIKNSKKMRTNLCDIYNDDILIMGPTPAFYERQRDTYRWQLVIKSSKRARLVAIQQSIHDPHWQCELDPVSLL